MLAVPQKSLIACVDDDASPREALEGFLKAFGFAPATFSSAEEFLQSDRLVETSCLITDIHLGSVGMWRGGVRSTMSVAAPFVWRCL